MVMLAFAGVALQPCRAASMAVGMHTGILLAEAETCLTAIFF